MPAQIELSNGGLHALLELIKEFLVLTREKARHTLYEKLVFFWTDRTATSTRTKPYMSIEARTVGEFEFVV